MTTLPKYAHISIHVESHEKYVNPHEGHKAFSRLLSDPSLPPMGLFWLRNKDEEKCLCDCQFSELDPKHEIGLHFHTVVDHQDPKVLLKAITKEKKLLEDRIGKKINSFSGGHFSLHKEGIEMLAQAGFTTDFTINPGLTMISAKGNPCTYRPDLPQSFWIETESNQKVLEFSLTTQADVGVLDILVNPLHKIYKLIQQAIQTSPGFIHLTAHSYDFIQHDLSVSEQVKVFRSIISILEKMGYQFLTQSQLFEEFPKTNLKTFPSHDLFGTKQGEMQ